MEKYLSFALKMAEKSGQALLKEFNRAEMISRDGSIHTKFDLRSDKLLIAMLEKQFPQHSYLTEETGWVKKDKKYLWIIDPIDGTGNFINKDPFFAVSIALWIDGQPVLGVIEAPALRERYWAVKGHGAWIKDFRSNTVRKAKISPLKKMSESYLLYCGGHLSSRRQMAQFVAKLYPQFEKMRKLGSGAIELAWIGAGRAEALLLMDAYLWDIAAGLLFVSEAGGRNLNFQFQKYSSQELLKMKEINLLSANKNLNFKTILN